MLAEELELLGPREARGHARERLQIVANVGPVWTEEAILDHQKVPAWCPALGMHKLS